MIVVVVVLVVVVVVVVVAVVMEWYCSCSSGCGCKKKYIRGILARHPESTARSDGNNIISTGGRSVSSVSQDEEGLRGRTKEGDGRSIPFYIHQ